KGNILTPRVISNISRKTEGVSTLSAIQIWFDQAVKRLNTDQRGVLLGEFGANDKILTIYASGHYRITNYDLTNHFDDDLIKIEKFNPEKPISVFYIDKESQSIYLKRFLIEPSNKKINIFEEQIGGVLVEVSTDWLPRIELEGKEYEVANLCDIFKWRAKGKRVSKNKDSKITWLEPLPYEEELKEEGIIDEDDEFKSEFNDKETIQGSLF
ncbi:MAG: hypothetical protein J6P97_05615, partial [Bacteroidales bacterium]|nr:hypothetical protein [Bacteroidales bacterium]